MAYVTRLHHGLVYLHRLAVWNVKLDGTFSVMKKNRWFRWHWMHKSNGPGGICRGIWRWLDEADCTANLVMAASTDVTWTTGLVSHFCKPPNVNYFAKYTNQLERAVGCLRFWQGSCSACFSCSTFHGTFHLRHGVEKIPKMKQRAARNRQWRGVKRR